MSLPARTADVRPGRETRSATSAEAVGAAGHRPRTTARATSMCPAGSHGPDGGYAVTARRLIGVIDAGATAGLSRKTAQMLARAGMTDTFRVGANLYVAEDAFRELAAAPTVVPAHPAVVLRVAHAVPVHDADRRFSGWSARLSREERLAGVDRWWHIASPRLVPAETRVVVTLSGLIVESGLLESVVVDPVSRRTRVVVDWDADDGYPVGAWLRVGHAGPIAYV